MKFNKMMVLIFLNCSPLVFVEAMDKTSTSQQEQESEEIQSWKTTLMKAIKNNDIKELQQALDSFRSGKINTHGLNFSYSNEELQIGNVTPLKLAIMFRNPEAVRMLLDAGAFAVDDTLDIAASMKNLAKTSADRSKSDKIIKMIKVRGVK